jgi:hypothetical protein
MTVSEGRTITIEPKSKLQAEAEFKAALRQRRMLDGSTLPVKSAGKKKRSQRKVRPGKKKLPQRKVWRGKGYELARKVKTELGSDFTQPGRFTAALEQACQRYKQKNGRRFTVKSLREGLRRWEDEQKG